MNHLSLPTSIIISGFIIAFSLYLTAPRYELLPIPSSTNPAVWKIDRVNGNVSLCATASGKDTEAGCTAKLKQF